MWNVVVLTPPPYSTEEQFPGPWTPDERGLARLSRRMLGYAGLPGLDVQIDLFEGDRSVERVSTSGEAEHRHHGAAAWFAGIEGGRARFGCSTRQLAEAGEGLIGVMAHEVAHAYRHVHSLVEADQELEECLTDLTTIYLGFGVFTVNNTFRFRTYSEERGGPLSSGYFRSEAGYLSPQAMSYLFAAWMLSRRLTCWQTWRVLSWLEPNQRGFTKSALRQLRPVEGMERRLVPDRDPPHFDLGPLKSGNREP